MLRALVGMSAAVLVILLAAMIFPALPEAAQAVEGDGGATTYATGASVSLGVPATIDFEAVTPTANGATTTATANVTVATTNSAGYSLYLYAESGNNLVAQNPATTEVVTATASSATLDGLANNTWGYNLGTATPGTGTTYAAVPTDGTTPVQTKDTSSTNAANDTYTLALGAKVDTTIPSGTYTGALTVAVVAEAKGISNLTELTYMQDMTPEICANSNENDTTRLIDSRDGKYYWVAKLKDGNCWMTQNLALDLSVDTPLTPGDSDVTSSWTPEWDTQTDATVGILDETATLSWNLGEYVSASPLHGATCQLTYGDRQPSPASCESFLDVLSMSPMTSISSGGDIVSGQSYDAHYLIGNYYQWSAATAGTGDSLTYTDASGSICPKGWHLPTSNNTKSGSFGYLINTYGYTTGDLLVLFPLYFVDAGFILVSPDSSSPQVRVPDPVGFFYDNEGFYWSSNAHSNSYAYGLYFNSGGVYSSNDESRYLGFSVRCLADQLRSSLRIKKTQTKCLGFLKD